MQQAQDTIVAVASGTGGAIAVVRISGPQAIAIADRIFTGVSRKPLSQGKGFTIHYGTIHGEAGETVDDVLASLFKAPHSYTGEDMVEISCHGSSYIKQEIIRLCIGHGARMAQAGEFTLRAFLSGKMDLSQAEAVADVIASDSKAALTLATRQIRGGYSAEFAGLRERLIELISLLELELDFSEEDVEFADRSRLTRMLAEIETKIRSLSASFRLGNILKNGIPVAIVGLPNVGKSTLLNALLNEERALVSDIAGTTRDVIEETLNIRGITFRFIDTAGIRDTADPLESLGIERTYQRLGQAAVVLFMADAGESVETICNQYGTLPLLPEQKRAILLNKADRTDSGATTTTLHALASQLEIPVLAISAKKKENLASLTSLLYDSIDADSALSGDHVIVSNARHHEALEAALEAALRAQEALQTGLSGDLIAQDLNEIAFHIGLITGTISNQDILTSIFSRFCIGK